MILIMMSKKEKQDLPLIFELSINFLGLCLGLCGSTISMWHKKDSSVNEFATKDIQQKST